MKTKDLIRIAITTFLISATIIGFVALVLSFGNPQWSKCIYVFQAYWLQRPPHCPDNFSGVWREWDLDGVLQSEQHFKDGILHGESTTWHSDGHVASKQSYEHGNPAGIWSTWNSTGDMIVSKTYRTDPRFVMTQLLDFERRGVRNFTFCPKTRRLYVSFRDKDDDLLYEWDVDKRTVIYKYQLGDGYMCDSVAVSPDGSSVAVGCWPLDIGQTECKTVIIQTSGDRKMLLLRRTDRTFSPTFSADGTLLWTDHRQAFDMSGKVVPNAVYKETRVANGSPWSIECSKVTVNQEGLYYRDIDGKDHRLIKNEWHDNYAITTDGRFIASTTWDGELVVWSTQTITEIYRQKIAAGYGYLCYDPLMNRFLLGDATDKGTTFLRALAVMDK